MPSTTGPKQISSAQSCQQPTGQFALNCHDGELMNGHPCDGCGETMGEIWQREIWQRTVKTDSAGKLFYRIHPKETCYSSLLSRIHQGSKDTKVFTVCSRTHCSGVTHVRECVTLRIYCSGAKSSVRHKSATTQVSGDIIACALCTLSLKLDNQHERMSQAYWEAGKQIALGSGAATRAYNKLYPQDKATVTKEKKSQSRRRRATSHGLRTRYLSRETTFSLSAVPNIYAFGGNMCEACEEPLSTAESDFKMLLQQTINLQGVWEPGSHVRTIHHTKQCWDALTRQKDFQKLTPVVICSCASYGTASYVNQAFKVSPHGDVQVHDQAEIWTTYVDGELIYCGQCRASRRCNTEHGTASTDQTQAPPLGPQASAMNANPMRRSTPLSTTAHRVLAIPWSTPILQPPPIPWNPVSLGHRQNRCPDPWQRAVNRAGP